MKQPGPFARRDPREI